MVSEIKTGRDEIEQELTASARDFSLDFVIAYNRFQARYFEVNTLDEESYADYMNLEDLFVFMPTPSRSDESRMNSLREIMQRYAEAHRD